MRILPTLGCVALFALLPAALHAQTCDVLVANGSWSVHPHPDSIYLNFYPDVTSDAPENPRLYDMLVNVRFDNVLVDQHQLSLRWAHGVGCPGNCDPAVICAEKEWSFKGKVFRDRSRCTLNAQHVCGCPPLGDPVVHRKPVPKPPVPVIIEIEIIPLQLQSCTPTNPGNDRVQFAYPGSGPTPIVPAMPPLLWVAVATGVLGLVILGARVRRTA